MKNILQISLLALIVFGCSPKNTAGHDARVKELLNAAKTFDREKYGFSPIQPSAHFRLQMYGSGGYDVMLHINRSISDSKLNKSGKTSRTVAFRKTPGGYQWVGDQEVFIGPNQYSDHYGTYYENITLTYETERITGFAVDQLNISYSGTDSRLPLRPNLDEIRPILKEWGY